MTPPPGHRAPVRRAGLALLACLAAAALPTPAGHAAPAATRPASTPRQLPADLVMLGYLASRDVASSTAQAAAVRHLQTDRCLDADGVAAARTLAQVSGQLRAVQRALKVTATGHANPATRSAIAAWQKGHHATPDGVAGAAVMRALKVPRTRDCGSEVVGDPATDSRAVACAAGTRDLGVHQGWARGHAVALRLCAIPGWRSTSSESVPGTRYYLPGARHDVIVTSRASGAYLGLFLLARNSGRTLVANSSFRTMAHQKALCARDRGCRRGDYTLVMRPGFSNHQLGGAVDIAGLSVHGTCKAPARQPSSATWRLLSRNAARFGIRQYPVESWHWEVRATGC